MATDSWHNRLSEIAKHEPGVDFSLLWSMLVARVFVDDIGSGYATLSPTAKTIWLVNSLIGEVHNGGFHQFFSNSSGNHAVETPAALAALRAHAMLALFQRATKLLSKDGVVPADRELRNDMLDSIFPDEDDCYEAFNELDSEFYALPESDHPDLMQFAYAHSDQLDFTSAEIERALESQPQLGFLRDRAARMHFDHETETIFLELESGNVSIPFQELQAVSMAKFPAPPGATGLVYRLDAESGTHDVPYFARGDSASNTPSLYFLKIRKSYPLIAQRDALAEARNPIPMQPFEIWRRVPEGS